MFGRIRRGSSQLGRQRTSPLSFPEADAFAEAIRDPAPYRSPLEAISAQHVREQVPPGRIVPLNELDLPVAPPSLHGALTARRDARVVARLEVNQPIDPVPLGETFEHVLAM